MFNEQLFGVFSSGCAAVGYGIYIRSVLKRETKPHLFSWIVWSLVLLIVFLAQVSKGAGPGAWPAGFSTAVCILTALLSVRYGDKDITISDWVAFAGSLATIPVWYFMHDPLWAVVLATVIDGLAYYPTFRKSYFKPYEEHTSVYIMDSIKWVVAFFAMQDFSMTVLLYPVFCFFANGGLAFVIYWRRARIAP
jgi:hypothetical protein